MEDKIEEELRKVYNFKITVNWKDFRIYKIECIVNGKIFIFDFLYDIRQTLESNLYYMTRIIDNHLSSLFKKKGQVL